MSQPETFVTIHNFNFSIHDHEGTPLRVYPARSLTEPFSRTVFVETPPTSSSSYFSPHDQGPEQQHQQRFDSKTNLEGQFSFRITPVTPVDFTQTLGYHFQTFFDGITDFASLNITSSENSTGGSRDCITVKDVPQIACHPQQQHYGGRSPYPQHPVPVRCKHFKLRFLPICWTDEEQFCGPGYFNPEDGQNSVGTIKFVIQEIESVRPSMYAGAAMNSWWNAESSLGQKTVYEKALKGRTLTHTIGASQDYKLTIPTTTLRLKPDIIGSITFHYRSRSTLQSMGIVPYDEPTFVAEDFRHVPKLEDINPFVYSMIPTMQPGPRTMQLAIREQPSSSRGWGSNISFDPRKLTKMVIRTNPNQQREAEYRQLNEAIKKIKIENESEDEGSSNVILANRYEVPIEEFDKERLLERRRRRAKRMLVKQQQRGRNVLEVVD